MAAHVRGGGVCTESVTDRFRTRPPITYGHLRAMGGRVDGERDHLADVVSDGKRTPPLYACTQDALSPGAAGCCDV